jgi:hypothetical protein
MKFPRLDRNAWNKLVQQLRAFRPSSAARLVIPVTLPPGSFWRKAKLDRIARCGFSCRSSMLRTHPMLQQGLSTNALLDFSRRKHPRGSSEDSPGLRFLRAPPVAARDFADGGD